MGRNAVSHLQIRECDEIITNKRILEKENLNYSILDYEESEGEENE